MYQDELKVCGAAALNLQLPFSEEDLLKTHQSFLMSALDVQCEFLLLLLLLLLLLMLLLMVVLLTLLLLLLMMMM